jgi:serine O-acetyltransferase
MNVPSDSFDDASPHAQWNLDGVIAGLRERRTSGIDGRHAGGALRLPSTHALARIVEGVIAALFPRHFGPQHLTDEGVDYFVGNTLDVMLRSLLDQVRRELRWAASAGTTAGAADPRAVELVREFARRLPDVRTLIESDVRMAYRGDPAAKSIDEVLICYPGVAAMMRHRIAHALHELGAPLLARIIAEGSHSLYGVDIHPAAQIGKCFFVDHGTGVVIGETTSVGERVRVYQAVTLGARSFPEHEDGTLVKGIPRHPIVEDDVVIYAGATILGRVTIGKGSTIGGNVWLTRSVPPGSNISQAQLRMELFDAGAGI